MSSRIEELAKPKPNRASWMTSHWPVDWSNQTTIRPLPRETQKSRTSERLVQLATPKKNFQLEHPECCQRDEFTYSCGRGSMVWQVTSQAKKAKPSQRIIQLSEPRKREDKWQTTDS
ncbi:testicular haploid expressed gene protein-like [Nematostella vectensis]|uniref:testicular haploid expressed gene protein-like n=1 Tax=Nematostella vectensis TaxID=45351 RepID=UPI00138FC808|nr:testicular haploid expressed gene protein-like [Nematostella vectensis]